MSKELDVREGRGGGRGWGRGRARAIEIFLTHDM